MAKNGQKLAWSEKKHIITEEPEQREPISTKQTPRYRNYIMSPPNKVAPHVNMLELPVVKPIRERSVVK